MTERSVILLTSLLAACVASDPGSDSQIDDARIIAVIATPAEVTPGDSVHLQAVIAARTPEAPTSLVWSLCRTPRASGENTAVSPACATEPELPLPGEQAELDAVIPLDACKRFGSETPSGTEPNRADATGGYYQPIRVALDDSHVAVSRQRIRCALPSAPIAAAQAFAQQYQPNRAPSIAALHVYADQREANPSAIPAHARVSVSLELAADARESYLFYDVHSGALVTQEEQLELAWFTSAGQFQQATLQVEQLAPLNTLQVPAGTSDAQLWLVLRDDRGGSALATLVLHWTPGGG